MLTALRLPMRHPTRLALATLLMVDVGSYVVAPPAEAATRRYTYFQFNVCDNDCPEKGNT
jgi:hypothetical protein